MTKTPAPVVALPVSVAAPVGPPPVAGMLAGSLGQALSEADRRTAFNSELAALNTGKKQSWRGATDTFGFVTLGDETGSCRAYTDNIYIGGHPKSGTGSACKQPDGTWKLSA